MDRTRTLWWKVIWTELDGRRKAKRFDNVQMAVDLRREIRKEGLECDVVSLSKAYPPQKKSGPRPSSKHLWCPYCIKWRVFKIFALRKDGILGPDLLRCSYCYVSTADYYIRRYNNLLGVVTSEQLKKGLLTFDRGG